MTLGHGKTHDQLEVMLETPEDMITLVAQGMLTWGKRYLGADVVSTYRKEKSSDGKAFWAGVMGSLKDTYNTPILNLSGSYGNITIWQDRGIESWELIDQWNIFNDE